MSVRLSILDQSPIIGGQTPAAAIHATLELAEAADRLGYHRYWLAEHHAMKGLADPCPEILLGQIGNLQDRLTALEGEVKRREFTAGPETGFPAFAGIRARPGRAEPSSRVPRP